MIYEAADEANPVNVPEGVKLPTIEFSDGSPSAKPLKQPTLQVEAVQHRKLGKYGGSPGIWLNESAGSAQMDALASAWMQQSTLYDSYSSYDEEM